MIRIGIIGFGKMGRIRCQMATESGKSRLVSVFDPELTSLDEPARLVSSAEDVYRDPEVDAVFICTPNHLNKPLTMAALAAGKHVFCEKPPAFTAADVKDIRVVEAKSGKALMYGFNHRHHESIRRMKVIIDSGEMGRILWMRGRYGKEVNDNFFNGWRAKKDLAGGGIMLDQGIHMLDLFLYLAGGFDEVQTMVSNLYWKIDGIEDNVFANFRSSRTGICASLHSTMTQWRYLFSLEIFLEKGAMILNGLKTSSGAYGDEDLTIKRNRSVPSSGSFDTEERIVFHTDTSWASEIAHFFTAIEDKRNVRIGTSTDAFKVMQLIDRTYASDLGYKSDSVNNTFHDPDVTCRTVIFGAGTDCARLLMTGLDNEQVIALVDNDKKRHGEYFRGYRIQSPDELGLLDFDRIRIASSSTYSIFRQLLQLGIPESKITSALLDTENCTKLAQLKGIHNGCPAVIIGNGPSLRIQDLDRLGQTDMVTFACNKIYLAFDQTDFRPTYYLVEDFLVAENNAIQINALKGFSKLFPEVLLRFVQRDKDTVIYGMTHQDPYGETCLFSENPLDFKWGASVVYTALQLATYTGCNPIYLIGVDFQFTFNSMDNGGQVLVGQDEVNHFLPNYRSPGERWNRPMLEYSRIAFEAAQSHAKRIGRRIYNATRGGALDVFPRKDFLDII